MTGHEPVAGHAPLALIAAVASNGIIGANDRLPWTLPSDLARFRLLTMGKPLLMGRRTFESIGRPLPGRFVVVLSRDPAFHPSGVTVVRALDEGLETAAALAGRHGAAETMVAGGGSVYAALIGRARRLYLTEVAGTPEGDTVFPPVDPAVFRETSRALPGQGPPDEVPFCFVVYERR